MRIDGRKTIDSTTIFRIEESRAVGGRFLQLARTARDQGEIDPVSVYIVERAESIALLQLSLMCLYCIRYSELKQLDLKHISKGRDFSITQKKTGHVRRVVQPTEFNQSHFEGLPLDVDVDLVEYHALKRCINIALPDPIREALRECNSSTHVFRHLRASWLYAHGCSPEEIRIFFNHESLSATRSYIHEGIDFHGTIKSER